MGKFIVCYLIVIFPIVGLTFSARRWALLELTTPAAHSQWRTWREDVRQGRDPQGRSVARRIPGSAEPPALVLLRDYFPVCLVAAIGFSSLLYAITAWFLVGALRDGKSGPRRSIIKAASSEK